MKVILIVLAIISLTACHHNPAATPLSARSATIDPAIDIVTVTLTVKRKFKFPDDGGIWVDYGISATSTLGNIIDGEAGAQMVFGCGDGRGEVGQKPSNWNKTVSGQLVSGVMCRYNQAGNYRATVKVVDSLGTVALSGINTVVVKSDLQ